MVYSTSIASAAPRDSLTRTPTPPGESDDIARALDGIRVLDLTHRRGPASSLARLEPRSSSSVSMRGGTGERPVRLRTWRRGLGSRAGLGIAVVALGCSPTGRLAAMGVSSIQSIEGHRAGIAGPISWWAGDMQVISKANAYGAFDLYVFTLVLKNIGTVPVTLTRMEWNVMDQDIIRGAPSSQATGPSLRRASGASPGHTRSCAQISTRARRRRTPSRPGPSTSRGRRRRASRSTSPSP